VVKINTNEKKDYRNESVLKLCELYPLYRKFICDLYTKDDFKLTKTQQMIVMSLWIHKSMSLTHLAAQISTSNEQATRAVGQLVKMGCVTRARNEINRRAIDIQLTDKAVEMIEETQKKALERIPETLRSMSDEDAKALAESLDKVGDILIRYYDSQKPF